MNYLVGGNKDAQHNRAWRYGKVSATFGAHSSLVLHQVSWHFCDRHPCTDWIPFRHQRASSRRCFGLCSRSDSEVRRTSSINHRKTFRSLSFYQVSLNNSISFLLTAILHKIFFFFQRSVKVHRAAIWILGEYATSADDIRSVMSKVRQSLGEIPIVDDEIRKAAGEQTDAENPLAQGTGNVTNPVASSARLVTADGTYATQSIFSAAVTTAKKEERPPLRKYVNSVDVVPFSIVLHN